MPKVGAWAKTIASTPPGTPENWTLGAPKHGAWEHEERPRQKKIAFGLFGAFENEAWKFQERPIENLFACPISGAKTIALGLQLLVPKVGS